MRFTEKAFLYWGILLVLGALGCSPKISEVVSPAEEQVSFSDGGEAEMPDRWWTAFEEPVLNELMEEGLGANFDLQTAWYRFREAEAIKKRAASLLFPFLEGSANAEIFSPESSLGNSEQFQAGLLAHYEIDLWGRMRSSVDAERFRTRASFLDYQTAALTVSAEIVRTWLGLAEAREQVEITTSQVETNTKVLELIKSRFGSGQLRHVDMLRQEQLLEATRERHIQAEARVQVLENQLAVLLGRAPREDLALATGTLPEPPPLPETGLPVDLVQRRPDVQSAFERLRASDRDLASAISNQYPRLTLSASLSSASNNADALFDSWVRSFAGNLLAPLFYGGQLRAEVKRSEAIKQQQVYIYGQSVLTAFREVEDALIRERKQQEAVESVARQLSLAHRANEQLRVAYFNGMGSYLEVLTALDEEQQLQRDLLTEKLILLEYRVALYRALAGGFETGE
ncbi:efflux transporter outer membrane subunit [Geofilum rubicundum]|uniref:RND efflux system, outer membrane lipoprotein, NodT n=1 Tax=Geofilum rubicundum JCM 15548 TaxID=1236989 RepID=A0A0E9LZT1_9BACT|nr:efflux transporter outer membrane subunit [Geofilum rubicundum]GAO30636.1 RND efflux system, outer membrane lipoprotein, NodT [Geofilum rubicundum JCM 15548]